MTNESAPRRPSPLRPLRIGFLALTDAAPLIVARHKGYFDREGLAVTLHREVGWATIREKIIYGELDAAPAPAPMLWSIALGIGCVATPVLSAFGFNRQGNALTLARRWHAAGVRDGSTLRSVARTLRGENRITLGVVDLFSSHHLHLRQWLRAAGLVPDEEVRIAVVPPAQMFRNLRAGTIDGYWAGEPWNTIAVEAGAGWCPLASATHAPGHLEKVLLVTERLVAQRPAEHRALIRALHEAAAWCDEPHHREELAELLSAEAYLNVPARVIAPALHGTVATADGGHDARSDFLIFHRNQANRLTVADGTTIQAELIAAGLLRPTVEAGLPGRLLRDDLYTEALELTADDAPSHDLHARAGS